MKKKFGAKSLIYPVPVVLLGANVNEKPNFNTLGNCGIMCLQPPTVYVSSRRSHYTNKGVRQNNVFSINIPSEELVVETDYCGLVSGKKIDKSKVFEVFYGELKHAPMIKSCPINLECRVVTTHIMKMSGWKKKIRFQKMEVIIGEVIETYVNEQCLTDGGIDMKKVNPFLYAFGGGYWKVGNYLAPSYNVGKNYTVQKSD